MIRLYLLGYKGYYVLSQIKDTDNLLIDVVVGSDSNVTNDYSQEIIAFCVQNNIRYYLRNNEPRIDVKYSLLIGWRWLINDASTTLIVFHDSLLPLYRGFNPLVTALINGDDRVGVTCLIGESEYDSGDIFGQESIKIEYPIKISDAIDALVPLYLSLVNKFISQIRNGNETSLVLKSQDHTQATYSLWRNEDDYFINWNWSAEKIKRMIDAVGIPYGGARAMLDNKIVMITDAEVLADVSIINRVVGKVLFKDTKGISIVCGEGLLKIQSCKLMENSEIYNWEKKFRLKFE